jgi:hypothetical protein
MANHPNRSKKEKHPLDIQRDADMALIRAIASRAVTEYSNFNVRIDRLDTLMDVMCVHFSVQRLRLADLLAADTGNFMHDITKINRHLDRENTVFLEGFSPRYCDRNYDGVVLKVPA